VYYKAQKMSRSEQYFFCHLGKHIWPALERRPHRVVGKRPCAECSTRRRRRVAISGDSFVGIGEVSEDADAFDKFHTEDSYLPEWYANYVAKQTRELYEMEIKLDQRAAQANPRHVTLEQGREMWLASKLRQQTKWEKIFYRIQANKTPPPASAKEK
jgi:hypothetical protein